MRSGDVYPPAGSIYPARVPAKPRRREPPRDLLKIGEVARRAGVNRGTIQHYLREGLLPRPVKTFRNMAYYDAACVERIRAIKELQSKRHLPLHVIRGLLGSTRSERDMARVLVEAQKAALDALTPPTPTGQLTMAAAARAFGFEPRLLRELARLGLITPSADEGETVLRGPDLEILAAIANLGRHGFQEELGFRPEDMVMYLRSMQELVEQEVRTFLRVATGSEHMPELARSAVDAATMLLVAVRRKLIADLLRMPDRRLADALAEQPAPRPGRRRAAPRRPKSK